MMSTGNSITVRITATQTVLTKKNREIMSNSNYIETHTYFFYMT